MSTLPIPLSPSTFSFLLSTLPLFFLQELETGLSRVPRTHYFSCFYSPLSPVSIFLSLPPPCLSLPPSRGSSLPCPVGGGKLVLQE